MIKITFFFFFFFSFINLYSQKKDSIQFIEKEKSSILIDKEHSPKKASLFSTILPGLGQVYNQKHWKVPIIYIGFATCIYMIHENNMLYKKYESSYYNKTGIDTLATNYYTFMSADDLLNSKNSAVRYRDLNYILMVTLYFLNIIDATVDAHFFDYDVNEDLSLNFQPIIVKNYFRQNDMTGLKLTFTF